MRRYLEIVRHPRMAPLLAASVLARLPVSINGLALILFLRAETGSFALAGAASGGLALGTGAGAPFMGRVVDRRGIAVLLPMAIANALGLVALVVLGRSGAPGAAIVAVAVATGAMFPPTASVLRGRLPELLRDDPRLVPSAYALDSVLLELSFVVSPLVVAVLVATVGASVALLASAVAVVSGTVAFTATLPGSDAPPAVRMRNLLGPLADPGIRTLVLGMVPAGFAIGALEVVVPAFSSDEGRPELAGVLLAVWSIGSAAGGLVYGALPRRMPLAALHLRFTVVLPVAIAPVLAADSIALMALLLLPAGSLIAPIIASRNELAGALAPAGTLVEALTWPLTAFLSGISFGAAVAGALIDASGWEAAVVAAIAGATVGAALSLVRRRSLAAATA